MNISTHFQTGGSYESKEMVANKRCQRFEIGAGRSVQVLGPWVAGSLWKSAPGVAFSSVLPY
jgi:hypothetical protein